MNVKDRKVWKSILGGLVLIWVLFSIGYIVKDQWNSFQQQKLADAYQKGIADSVRQLMSESEKCTPIPVFEGEKEVNLIPIECLQPREADTSNENETGENSQ